MKTVAALLAGLMLSTMTFVAGLAIALAFLNIDEPERKLDTSDNLALWSTSPVAVNRDSQPLERVAAQATTMAQKVAAISKAESSAKVEINRAANTKEEVRQEAIDPTVTGSTDTSTTTDDSAALNALLAAHEQWCSRRYRSYSAETNTYRSHSGGQRLCRSPYSDIASTTTERPDEETTMASGVEDAEYTQITQQDTAVGPASYNAMAENFVDGDHIEYCLGRYRSYRPEDNTFQPYGGGPRQECL